MRLNFVAQIEKCNYSGFSYLNLNVLISVGYFDQLMYVARSMTLHNLLFCAHTLCKNYVTNTFLLVSSSVRSKQLLCFVQGQGQKT